MWLVTFPPAPKAVAAAVRLRLPITQSSRRALPTPSRSARAVGPALGVVRSQHWRQTGQPGVNLDAGARRHAPGMAWRNQATRGVSCRRLALSASMVRRGSTVRVRQRAWRDAARVRVADRAHRRPRRNQRGSRDRAVCSALAQPLGGRGNGPVQHRARALATSTAAPSRDIAARSRARRPMYVCGSFVLLACGHSSWSAQLAPWAMTSAACSTLRTSVLTTRS